ncbi:embryonic protein UVS.2-like isoform X2 [Xenopus laevis]|uniref:Metalloendopeptidase n=2 Tax=Xenopus laevis TaxID=8355 RepID=A0A8J1KJH3_XENLA|nr:embryonic protein UVS.2-like isoform X2 [Xenopus laevis]
METQIRVLILSHLLGLALLFPAQILPDSTINATDMNSNDVFSKILRANLESGELRYQGDIENVRMKDRAFTCQNCLWSKSQNGTVLVPYELSEDYNESDIELISDAMLEFATLSCVRFVPRQAETDYIAIRSENGCYSSVGRPGGPQLVSLLKSACLEFVIIQHELNHVLGFGHENSRSDRDDFITVAEAFILPEFQHNFEKVYTNSMGMEYDYSSIMHYGSGAFSNTPNQNTIVPKHNPNLQLGQQYGLSNLDISKINRLYECDACSTLLSTPSGILFSANYPSPYPNNASCVWLIRIPQGQVSLQFDSFDVQLSAKCSTDYVRVFDGASKSSPLLLQRACGRAKLPTLISSSRWMLVEFISDGDRAMFGFKASFSTVQCGGVFYTSPGNISSPEQPKNDCLFLISAPQPQKVLLRIHTLNIEASNDCKCGYLAVYNGNSTYSPLMHKFCEPTAPVKIISSGNSLLLKFYRDPETDAQGFSASFHFA